MKEHTKTIRRAEGKGKVRQGEAEPQTQSVPFTTLLPPPRPSDAPSKSEGKQNAIAPLAPPHGHTKTTETSASAGPAPASHISTATVAIRPSPPVPTEPNHPSNEPRKLDDGRTTAVRIPRKERKRSSSQLLLGLGKGLGRVGSVMRRNVSDDAVTNSLQVAEWERVEGDAGVSRPFNTEHDLHVSPDLADLPPAWLVSLKAQGLTESDLMLIAAARARQNNTNTTTRPLRGTEPPLATPASRRDLPMPKAKLPSKRLRGESTPHTALLGRSASTAGLLKKLLQMPHPEEPVPSPSMTSAPAPERSPSADLWDPFAAPAEMTARRRLLSDQLRCFSELHVTGEEEWGSSLISAMQRTEGIGEVKKRIPSPPPDVWRAAEDLAVRVHTTSDGTTRMKWDDDYGEPSKNGEERRLPRSSPLLLPKETAWPASPTTPRPRAPVRDGSSDAFGGDLKATSTISDEDLGTSHRSHVVPSSAIHNKGVKTPTIPRQEPSRSAQQAPHRPDSSITRKDVIPLASFSNPSQADPAIVTSDVPMPSSHSLHSRTNHFSLPATASIASFTPSHSRPTSPSSLYEDSDPLSRLDRAGKDERASIALSVMSSGSGMQSLHEATIQLAYTRLLAMRRRVSEAESRTGAGSDFEDGISAIVALEEAARRIAGDERGRQDDLFPGAD